MKSELRGAHTRVLDAGKSIAVLGVASTVLFHRGVTTPDDPNAPSKSGEAPERDDDEDRAAILRRRAVFIASAIAGLGVASCSGDPRPCLDVRIDPGTDTQADPGPCLSIAYPEPDAGSTTDPADADAGAETPSPPDAGDGDGAAPTPCLKVAPPRPCLKVAPPTPCLSPPAPPPTPAPTPCLSQKPPDQKPPTPKP